MGFGTSTPDLATSPQATFDGLLAIAVGNVVGSNADILPILGLAVVILLAPVESFVSRRDGTGFAVANLFDVAPMLSGVLDRWMGSILGRRAPRQARGSPRCDRAAPAANEGTGGGGTGPGPVRLSLVMAIVGISPTILGARLAVDAAVVLALPWGTSETVVAWRRAGRTLGLAFPGACGGYTASLFAGTWNPEAVRCVRRLESPSRRRA